MYWKPDSSGKLSVKGNVVTLTSDVYGSKANAIYGKNVDGIGYFEFGYLGNSGAWIGVSTESNFGEGYKLKGLFFGGPGNLSDGGALLAGEWGPSFSDGDTIGMYVESTTDHLKIAYSRNGAGLGIAFDIQGWNGDAVYPAVSLQEPGQVITINELKDIPDISRFLPSFISPDIEGKWEGICPLTISHIQGEEYRVSAKPANSINCLVQISSTDGAVLSSGRQMSTMMMPPPDVAVLESEVSQLLSSLTAIKRDGLQLILEGQNQQRHIFDPVLTPPVVLKNMVHWLNE